MEQKDVIQVDFRTHWGKKTRRTWVLVNALSIEMNASSQQHSGLCFFSVHKKVLRSPHGVLMLVMEMAAQSWFTNTDTPR